MGDAPTGQLFVCSRQIECLMEIRAPSLRLALSQLPNTPDELLEQADGVAFGGQWEVQVSGHRSTPKMFDDSDVEEAKSLPVFVPGDDL